MEAADNPIEEQRAFGRRLASLREQLGLTQEEFAEKIGISASGLRNYEQGMRCPHLLDAPEIARVLGVTVDFLLDISQEMANVVPRKRGRPKKKPT